MSSKILGPESSFFAEMAVDAVTAVRTESGGDLGKKARHRDGVFVRVAVEPSPALLLLHAVRCRAMVVPPCACSDTLDDVCTSLKLPSVCHGDVLLCLFQLVRDITVISLFLV